MKNDFISTNWQTENQTADYPMQISLFALCWFGHKFMSQILSEPKMQLSRQKTSNNFNRLT